MTQDLHGSGGGAPPFAPARVVEIDVARPLAFLTATAPGSRHVYRRVLALVRLGREPLGIVELAFAAPELAPEVYGRQIWQALGASINARLRAWGEAEVDGLESRGLRLRARPPAEPAAARPRVTVAIATRDRTDSLVPCLDSLLALDYPNYDILVVDSAPSSGATAALIRERYADRANLRYLFEKAPGLAIAHNRALSAIDAPIVAFTDDDVIADRHWLSALVEEFCACERVGCVTGAILPLEMETEAQAWFEQYGGLSKGFERRSFELAAPPAPDGLFPFAAGAYGSGANMAFRTAALRAIGGFDPALGAGTRAQGGDDLAAFFDIVSAGYRLVYQPGAIVQHRHRRDYAGLRRQTKGYGVGLGAYLTRILLERRRPLDLLRRVPQGVSHMLRPTSPKNLRKSADYPASLTLLELGGLVYGPIAYLHSRLRTRHLRRALASGVQPAAPGLDGAAAP